MRFLPPDSNIPRIFLNSTYRVVCAAVHTTRVTSRECRSIRSNPTWNLVGSFCRATEMYGMKQELTRSLILDLCSTFTISLGNQVKAIRHGFWLIDRAKQHIAELICFEDVHFESGGALSLETKRTPPGLLVRKLSQADNPLRSTDLAQRCATASSSSSEGSSRRCLQFIKVLGKTIAIRARKGVGAALG